MKNLRHIDSTLFYLGICGGLLLLAENFLNLSNKQPGISSNIFLFALILWLIGFVLRVFVYRKKLSSEAFVQIKLEAVLLLFSYLTVILYSVSLLKYNSLGIFQTQQEWEMYQTFSGSLNYFSNYFIFALIINIAIFIGLIVVFALISKLLFLNIVSRKNHLLFDVKGSLVKMLIISVLFILTFGALNIPGVSNYYLAINKGLIGVLHNYFQWVIDLLYIYPLYYYLKTIFISADMVERFALKKLV